jgi:hypothetical protein
VLRAKKGLSFVEWLVSALLYGAGVFTLALGTAHFFLPRWLDFRTVILERAPDWKAPHPFRLWPTAYTATPRDLNGVIWVMNHSASYTLVGIGLLDLFAQGWLLGAGRLLALWVGGFWSLRAATQLTFGRRWGDWLILAWFAALGALHLWVALR